MPVHAVGRPRLDLRAHHELAAIGLGDVDVHLRGDDHDVEQRLDRLGHARLQDVRGDRQRHAGHVGDQRAPAGGGVDDLAGLDAAAVRLAPRVMRPFAALEPGDLGVGMDLRAARVGAAREAPDDGVVADDAARRVVERAHDRIGRVVGRRTSPARASAPRPGRSGASRCRCRRLTSARLAITNIARSVCASVRWPHWREQQVEVQLLREPLVELDRGVVEARALRRLVVRAQDRRVAPGRARADVALLEDRRRR